MRRMNRDRFRRSLGPQRPITTTTLTRLIWIVAALWLLAGPSSALAATRLTCERVPELFRTYLQKHIDFHYLNDELRTRAIDNYVKRIDPTKVLFLQDEVTALESSMVGIFQDIREGDCSQLLAVEDDVKKRIVAMQEMVREILADEDYAVDENATLILDPEKRGRPANADAQRALVLQLVQDPSEDLQGTGQMLGIQGAVDVEQARIVEHRHIALDAVTDRFLLPQFLE